MSIMPGYRRELAVVAQEADETGALNGGFSDSNDEVSALPSHNGWRMSHLSIGAMLLVGAVVGAAIGAAATSWGAAPGATVAPPAPPRSLLDSPQFRQICHENVRRMMGPEDTLSEEELNQGIDQGLKQLQTEIDKRFGQHQAPLLAASSVREGDWGTVGAAISALSDPRMKRFSDATLKVATSNQKINSAQELGALALNASDLSQQEKEELLRKVLPKRLLMALQRRAAEGGESAAQQQELLSAAALEWAKQVSAPSASGAEAARRLAAAPAPAPTGLGLNLGVGIPGMTFLVGFEILLHIDVILDGNGFSVIWLAGLMATAAAGLGIANCVLGLATWCTAFKYAVTLNVLEAAAMTLLQWHGNAGAEQECHGYDSDLRCADGLVCVDPAKPGAAVNSCAPGGCVCVPGED